ncbi:MAG: ArsR/SmtB family transcription factor [Rhizobiaceae bacterium]
MELDGFAENARSAAEFLKALGHEQRLLILCSLSQGECSYSDIEQMLSARQPAVSQHFSRLVPVTYELFCSGN